MAASGISAFTPQAATLGTGLANFGDAVAADLERTYRFMRASNKTASDQTVTVMVAGTSIAFEMTVPAKKALNIIGPDTLGPLPAGTQIQARGSAPNAVDLFATGTDRDLATLGAGGVLFDALTLRGQPLTVAGSQMTVGGGNGQAS